MNVRFLCAATIAAGLLLGDQFAVAQRAQGNVDQMTLRVYQLADMILPLPNHGYRPEDLPATPAGTSAGDGRSSALGSGLGGGFGGSGGGGGAAFNVQFGGGGQSGGGQPGGGGFGNSGGGFAPGMGVAGPARGSTADEAAAMAMDQIVELITASIEPNSWEQLGGPGTIGTYRSLLVVSQTDAAHAKIDTFLNMLRDKTGTLRTVTVAAHWLLLDSDQLAKLQVERDGRTSIDRDQLAKLTRDENSYRGQITCFSGQTVHLVGGVRRNVVTGVIPVVGSSGGPAYQPRGAMPNLGVLLQVRPTLVADADAAIVDLESWVTNAPGEESMLEFQSSQPSRENVSGGDDESDSKANDKNGGTNVRVDRLNISSQSLATTLRAPVGVPVLAGGLTAMPEIAGESGELKQHYLIVQINVADDASRAETTPQPLQPTRR